MSLLRGWLAVSSGKLHADWLEVFEVNTRKTSCRTESNRDGNTTAAQAKSGRPDLKVQRFAFLRECVSKFQFHNWTITWLKLANVIITEQSGHRELLTNAQEAALLISRSLFFSCYDFCLHCLSVFADSADARFMCLIYTPDRCTVHWKGSFFFGGGCIYSVSVREVKQEQSCCHKAHCHHWPAESKAFLRLGYSVSSYASALG